MTVELSVVIPAYNAEETFGDQLAALTRQVDPGNFEVVVVDNRSTDRTREVAQNFADRLDLRVVDASQRAGEPYARNVGLEAARSDKVAFCDADDVVDAGWVGAMRRALADHRLVTGPLELEELNPPWIRATRRNPQEFRPQSKYGFLPHGAGANLGVDRVAALEIGGFDETLPSLPDTDFCWRMQLAGYELHFAPDAIVHYRLRHRTRDVIRQARQYAVADVALHRRYESQGMPPIRVSSALGGWAELALRAPLLLTRAGRFRYAWMLGFRLGRIQGMMRYRFPAL